MAHTSAFAIGSLFPELKNATEENISTWADAVESSLNLVPSVSDLKISGANSTVLFDTGDAKEFDDLIQHPIPANGRIEFRITIPSRIQERLMGWRVSKDNEITEFLVIIDLNYRYPCTFVTPVGQGKILAPSGAVIIVREFLKKVRSRLRSMGFLFLLGCIRVGGRSPISHHGTL
ncbi:hypothetical protein ACWGMA_00895 [Streptomyces asiaticus]